MQASTLSVVSLLYLLCFILTEPVTIGKCLGLIWGWLRFLAVSCRPPYPMQISSYISYASPLQSRRWGTLRRRRRLCRGRRCRPADYSPGGRSCTRWTRARAPAPAQVSRRRALFESSPGFGRVFTPQAPFTQDIEVLANAACKKWKTLLPMGVFAKQHKQHQRICLQTCLRVLCEPGLTPCRGRHSVGNGTVFTACKNNLTETRFSPHITRILSHRLLTYPQRCHINLTNSLSVFCFECFHTDSCESFFPNLY